MSRRCDNNNEHQPLLDGGAKDAAIYPQAQCRAIRRGIAKEKMERRCNVTPMMTVGDGPHVGGVDVEDSHERNEVDIPALIRKIEEAEEKLRDDSG